MQNYAVLPTESCFLEKELSEQDELFSAFKSIIKSQSTEKEKSNTCSRKKPTTLSLRSSHTSKTVKHSNSCDILVKRKNLDKTHLKKVENINNSTSLTTHKSSPGKGLSTPHAPVKINIFNKTAPRINKPPTNSNSNYDSHSTGPVDTPTVDIVFSPDSLVGDDNSSSPDYLSAAYTSPLGVLPINFNTQFNQNGKSTKMDKSIIISDSDLENSGPLESRDGDKDHIATNTLSLDLTERTLNESPINEVRRANELYVENNFKKISTNLPLSPKTSLLFESDKNAAKKTAAATLPSVTSSNPFGFESSAYCFANSSGQAAHDKLCNDSQYLSQSSKEEKQRYNEEIVILESSSSLSSETGSWESVFPPKAPNTRETCLSFIENERKFCSTDVETLSAVCITKREYIPVYTDEKCPSLVQRSPFKATSCFIDAASLVDENETIEVQRTDSPAGVYNISVTKSSLSQNPQQEGIRKPKHDLSPLDNEWSGDNENDDSLEHCDDDENPVLIQKGFSPTKTEDALSNLLTGIQKNLLDFSFQHTIQEQTGTNNIICEQQHQETSITNQIVPTELTNLVMPETPHNSMLLIYSPAETNHPVINEGAAVSSVTLNKSRRKKKCDESSPIVSGGASVEDHLPQIRTQDSPLLRPKFESTPIVSGAHLPDGISKVVQKNKNTPATSSWVVDMSDKTLTGSEKSESNEVFVESENLALKLHSSSLNISHNKSSSSVDSDSERSSRKFFIDLLSMPDLPTKDIEDQGNECEKKKLFPMYFNMADKNIVKEMPKRLTSSFRSKCQTQENSLTSNSEDIKTNSITLKKKTASGMPENNDKVIKYIATKCNYTKNKIKEGKNTITAVKSTNIGRKNFYFTSVKELPKINKPTSVVNTVEANTSASVNTYTIEGNNCHKSSRIEYKDDKLRYNRKNNTEYSNLKIGNQESFRELDDLHRLKNFHDDSLAQFEHYEKLCKKPDLNIDSLLSSGLSPAKIDKINTAHDKISNSSGIDVNIKPHKITSIFEKSQVDQENTTANNNSSDLFVKLSDLDKPVPKTQLDSITESVTLDRRMTQSIPGTADTAWRSVQHNTCRSTDVFASFHSENALSLNRLFPHLKQQYSQSMPGSILSRTHSSLRFTSANPVETEQPASVFSETSSVQSSVCPSNIDCSTQERISQSSGGVGNSCQSRLGQDLLSMFLEEIVPDVTVEVAGRRIKAHKCILSSRCQYFASILSGGWVESAGNVIYLEGFSYSVVHFALCHIYSGASTIPDSLSIVDLVNLADVLGLEGLKEVVTFTLMDKYCHHFHMPCTICSVGVLECLNLSNAYNLDELLLKCLRWITKHFTKIWPTKVFATLPQEIIDRCYQEHVVNMSIDNVITTVFGCGIIIGGSLPHARWAESVSRACGRLINAAAAYTAPRLVAVLPELLNTPMPSVSGAHPVVADWLDAAFTQAPPDQACEGYQFLQTEITNRHEEDIEGKQQNPKLKWYQLTQWRNICEKALVRAVPSASRMSAYKKLSPELQARLRELGCNIHGVYSDSTLSLASFAVKQNVQIVNKPGTLSSPNRAADHSKLNVKTPTSQSRQPNIRTTKAQDKRTLYNRALSEAIQQSKTQTKTSRVNRFENMEPRYLKSEIQNNTSVEKANYNSKNRIVTQISSDSSRNLSPIIPSTLMPLKSTFMKIQEPEHVQQTRNIYATYTKCKNAKGNYKKAETDTNTEAGKNEIETHIKTKIPIYLNTRRPIRILKTASESKPLTIQTPSPKPSLHKNVSGRLMSATKSSLAKITVKSKTNEPKKGKGKVTTKVISDETRIINLSDIPELERSGTFLKDEATFLDRREDIDKSS